jgi:hypothetical protein
MKLALIGVFVVFLFSMTVAQKSDLPDVLKPDDASIAEARRLGVNVFKILPRRMFEAKEFNSYKDEENPIGIRGGGAYYSFTTESHSIAITRFRSLGMRMGNCESVLPALIMA